MLDANDSQERAAVDGRLLRERAERLLATAHTLTDVASRTGLVIEAAMLHRLATVGEEQVAALRALDPQIAAELRSFAALRPKLPLN
jgi:hypothetical protein